MMVTLFPGTTLSHRYLTRQHDRKDYHGDRKCLVHLVPQRSKMYLFIGKTKLTEKSQRKILHPLVHTPSGRHGRSLLRVSRGQHPKRDTNWRPCGILMLANQD